MKITNPIIAAGISIILLSFIVIIYFKAKKDINRYSNILIKETIISFPIGLLMLGYQMYKFGQWGLSQGMYGFYPLFCNLCSIFIILANKYWEVRGYNYSDTKGKLRIALSVFIVFTPVLTIEPLIELIFGIK